MLIVLDGGGNVKKACKLLNIPSHTCFAHDLQRCILYALGLAGKESQNPTLKSVIGKAKKLTSAVHHSTQLTKAIDTVRTKRGEKPLKLVQDVPTRWNSTHAMCKSLNILHPDITVVLQSTSANRIDDDITMHMDDNTRSILQEEVSCDEIEAPSAETVAAPRDYALNETEYGMMRYIEGFASPTSTVTRILEGELYVTANRGWPSLKLLQLNYKAGKVVVPAV